MSCHQSGHTFSYLDTRQLTPFLLTRTPGGSDVGDDVEHLAKVLIFDDMKKKKKNKETGLKLHRPDKSTKMSLNCMKTPHMKTTRTSKTTNSTKSSRASTRVTAKDIAPMKIATRKPKSNKNTPELDPDGIQ